LISKTPILKLFLLLLIGLSKWGLMGFCSLLFCFY
jgi:hypothetical protein